MANSILSGEDPFVGRMLVIIHSCYVKRADMRRDNRIVVLLLAFAARRSSRRGRGIGGRRDCTHNAYMVAALHGGQPGGGASLPALAVRRTVPSPTVILTVPALPSWSAKHSSRRNYSN